MKIKSLFFVMASAVLSMQFGCSSESLGSDNGSGAGATCPAVGDLTVEFRNGGIGSSEFCSIGGELTQSATLSIPADGFDWFLDGDITVSSGTLTIMPGVEVFAEGAEEYIYIQNGAAINAMGTENLPILFSSNDDGEEGGDEWGGVIIESLLASEAIHRLTYVVVAEAGLPVTLSGETYSANISFVGEHEDTIVRFLQSHASGNDGLAMVSEGSESTVLFEDIVVTDAANDSIFFNNFSGLLKNVLSIQSGLDSVGAGMRGGGVNSNPLVINTTFIGGDLDPQIGGSKVGFIFEDDFEMPRIANSAIVNFRGGCYNVVSPTNLSALQNDDIPDPSFIDGVHCVNEFLDLSGQNSAPSTGIFLPSNLVNFGISGEGLSFYENTNALFEDEASGATETAAYYLTQIGGFVNGTNDLQRYNGGDANLDGNTDADDEDFGPLFGINDDLDPLYRGLFQPEVDGFGCDALSQLPSGAEFRDSAPGGSPVAPQPDPNDFVCGFLFVPEQTSGFNLTVIGAVESSSDTRFDNWTIDGSL